MKELDEESPFRTRQEVFERLFGPERHVWHERTGETPHIDIYCFEPGQPGRDFFTLATAGMSDRRMNVPAGAPPELHPRRIELVFYCSDARQEYAELLRRLAHYVFDNKTWLGAGHTMTTHHVELLASKSAQYLLFFPTPVMPDDSLPMRLEIDGDPVTFLWVIPITADELLLTREEWYLRAIVERFNRTGRPYVFSPNEGRSG